MHGMLPSEAAIMRLWDAGQDKPAIAAQLGYSEARVANVVRIFNFDLDAMDAAHERRMALGSITLLAAIKLERAKGGIA